MLHQVIAYVDGSSLGNPGAGGFGIVLRDTASGMTKRIAGNRVDVSNNQMELLAAIIVLARLKVPCKITFVSDSKYLVEGWNKWLPGWVANGWKRAKNKPVANAEMWQHLVKLAERHEVSFEWTKGHNGHAENEEADRLARTAASKLAEGLVSPKIGWANLVTA